MTPTVHPYTDDDLSEGQIIVQQLHGLKGYDAWAEHIAKALAHEREKAAEIAEGWPSTFDGMVSPQGRYAAENIAAAIRRTPGENEDQI